MNRITKVTLTIALAWTALTCRAAPISGPIVNPDNGHIYYLLSQNNWTGAEAEAVALGGHLVTVNDAVENQWVFNTFASFGGSDRLLWIGLHDVATSGPRNWQWVSSEPFTYSNWAPPEPSYASTERWVYMYPNNAPNDGFQRNPGTWNNYSDLSTEFVDHWPLFGVVEIAPPPRLHISIEGGNVVLAWPVAAGACQLQKTDNMATPGWSDVSETPVVVDDDYRVTLPLAGFQQYFCLIQL